jgi:hypothetical protein
MPIAIRPPEYFPRLSYFALMLQADHFIIADTFQYSRQSFQNRCQIRTSQGQQWLSLTLKGGQHGNAIQHTLLDAQNLDWKRHHLRTLETNYRSSAFFLYYEDILRDFFKSSYTTLSEISIASIQLVYELLGFTTRLQIASDQSEPLTHVNEWMHQIQADTLLSLPDTAPFDMGDGYETRTFSPQMIPYHQNFQGFIPNLSILDLLFNYGPESVLVLREMMENALEEPS